MRILGAQEGGYTLAVVDGCREYLAEAMRGERAEDQGINLDIADYVNLVIWFGCPPGSGVNANSTIAKEFFT